MKTSMMAAACALALTGCATFSADGGMDAVDQATRAQAGVPTRLLQGDGDRRALAEQLQPLLAQALGADDAVRIALLNNRGLQATYRELGIAEADLVQAGRLQNPAFGYQHMRGGGTTAIERSLTVNLVNLVTAPLAVRIEGRLFAQAKLRVTGEALKVAADTRRAYYEAVGGAQAVEYARQVGAASDAGALLAERMRQAGNWSKYDEAREKAFHAEVLAEVARASKGANAARERLARLLGLDQPFQLPDRLPDLPAAPHELADVEQSALRDRPDVQAARLATEHTAATLGLTRATRFVNVLELGGVRESGGGEPRQRGYELSLEIPLFDWGTARTRRAEAVYMQSVDLLAAAAVNARSEAREAYAAYRTSYELAKHYRDVVIPLRKQLSDETLLRYNGMLLGTFELLADAREQIVAVGATIEALQSFWVADADLETALGSRLAHAEPVVHQHAAPPSPAPAHQHAAPEHQHSHPPEHQPSPPAPASGATHDHGAHQ